MCPNNVKDLRSAISELTAYKDQVLATVNSDPMGMAAIIVSNDEDIKVLAEDHPEVLRICLQYLVVEATLAKLMSRLAELDTQGDLT